MSLHHDDELELPDTPIYPDKVTPAQLLATAVALQSPVLLLCFVMFAYNLFHERGVTNVGFYVIIATWLAATVLGIIAMRHNVDSEDAIVNAVGLAGAALVLQILSVLGSALFFVILALT